MKILSFIDKKIPVRFLFILFPIMILQLLLPVRKIALFLIDDLNIPFELLSITELLTVPISVLILCLFLIQKLNWKWLAKKTFFIGFISIYFLNIIAVIFSEFLNINPPLIFDIIYGEIYSFFRPTVYIFASIYEGWAAWTMHFMNWAFVISVIYTTMGGIIYSLYKNIKQ